MKCPRLFLLVRYNVGDLPLQKMLEIREHLEGCEGCREILAGMERRRRNFLSKHSAGEVVPGLLERARPGWLRRLWRWLRKVSGFSGTLRHPKKTGAKRKGR